MKYGITGASGTLGRLTADALLARVDASDVVLVTRGHHPCGAPYGFEMYYLNVMAGPRRAWHFKNDPDHEWMLAR